MVDAKEWLRRGWDLSEEIERHKKLKARAEHRAAGLSGGLRSVRRKKAASRKDRRMVEAAEYGAMVEEFTKELDAVLIEIHLAVMKIGDSASRSLLMERYMLMNPWHEVALNMNYSLDSVKGYLHANALKAMAEVLNKPGIRAG